MASIDSRDKSLILTTGVDLSREEAILHTYFMYLSKFSFDKSKEIIDKEREVNKAHASLLWSSTLNILNTLANSEKSFYSLVFLSHNFGSRFFRKDTLKTIYNCILTELNKIETAHSGLLPSSGNVEQIIGRLSGLLQHFITARIKTIGLYEQMIGLGNNHRSSSYEDLSSSVSDIKASSQLAFQHNIIGQLDSSFSLECDCMKHLLEAQISMQSCQYLPALLHLYNAHCKLNEWSTFVVVRDSKKLAFVGSVPKLPSLALYDWMVKYKNALLAKFSLYYYVVLSKQGQPHEVRSFLAKMTTDFYSKIAGFQKKYDVVNISLIFDARSLKSEAFKGPGYHHPLRYSEEKADHTGYHSMFSYPSEMSDHYWHSTCKLCSTRCSELDSSFEKPVYACEDENTQRFSTYLLMRVDPLVTLIATWDSKKTERDTNILSSFSIIAQELRCNKICLALRPG